MSHLKKGKRRRAADSRRAAHGPTLPPAVSEPTLPPFEAERHIKHPKKRALLTAYAECGNIRLAASIAGIDRRTHYRWTKSDDAYAADLTIAKDQAVDRLEQEAWRRGREGVQRPVYQGGKLVGYEQVYSDVLLIFLLKGARPEVYRERFDHELHAPESLRVAIERTLALSREAPLVGSRAPTPPVATPADASPCGARVPGRATPRASERRIERPASDNGNHATIGDDVNTED